MKKRLLFAAALIVALVLPSARKADAQPDQQCFEENYGGSCATTCVTYNDQGSAESWCTTPHAC